MIEDLLAHAQALGGDLQQLVVVDELQALLQGEGVHGDQAHRVLGGGGVAHVGDVLLLADVDGQIHVVGVLAADHAHVDLLARADEERAALLGVEEAIGGGGAASNAAAITKFSVSF